MSRQQDYIPFIQVNIQDVIIKARKRPLDTVKVAKLAESIKQVGLLQPIVIDEHNNLLAGAHRIEAFRLLGESCVPAIIRQNGNTLLAELTEIDENLIRNELTVLEQGEHLKRRDEILSEMGQRRQTGALPGTNNRGVRVEDTITKGEFSSPFKSTPEIASEVGLSERIAQQRKQIANQIADEVKEEIRHTELADRATDLLHLARLAPEVQKEAAERVLSGQARNVKQATKQLKREKQIEAIDTTIWPTGKYHVIAIDPPWAYDNRANDESHRAANPYPSMTVEEIIALDIPELALNDCVLWLWTTNAFMEEAHQVARAWGFEKKTILTWVKDRMGTGDWLRGQTEHCLLCVKGNPVINLTNQTTVIYGPLREHSRKPEEFYQLVQELCPGHRVELFARQVRDGWTPYGNEVDTF